MQSRHLSWITVRRALLAVSMTAALVATTALAAEPTTPAPAQQKKPWIAPQVFGHVGPNVVYLTGAQSLDELRDRNPQHYARAMKIIAAADSLCKPGTPNVVFAKYDARFITCSRMTIYTSLPPQRQLTFRLDDVEYIAMVVLKEPAGKLIPAH